MERLFALGDLHLSQNGDKPMDRFGESWRDHARRMAANWDATVGPGDIVLLAGDLSWAKNLDQATPDLAWIGERPGRKILLRGNHDSWWPRSGMERVRRALPVGCEILQGNALEAAGWVIVGARGWTRPDDPAALPGDERVFRREIAGLRASLEDADRRFGRSAPRLALLHFPPRLEGREPTEVVPLLAEGGVRACVYGHLHGDDHRLAVRGARDGILYHFVAADAVAFTPCEIPRP